MESVVGCWKCNKELNFEVPVTSVYFVVENINQTFLCESCYKNTIEKEESEQTEANSCQHCGERLNPVPYKQPLLCKECKNLLRCKRYGCKNYVKVHPEKRNLCRKCYNELQNGKIKCNCGEIATECIVIDGEAEFFCYPCS